jgi:alkyl hydroperoxide reductase subunit D
VAALDAIRDALPEVAKDIRLNLQSVLTSGSLTPAQSWGTAVASAAAARQPALTDAVIEDALAQVPAAVVEDALAAAALMGMNNVYYRFRHLVGKEGYSTRPARLRMNRIVQPATNRADFELFCLAVSAINACEACIRSHEDVTLKGGLTEDQVHDAVRIAATVNAAAIAWELAPSAGRARATAAG